MPLDSFFDEDELQRTEETYRRIQRKTTKQVKKTRKVSLKAYDENRKDLSVKERQFLKGVRRYKALNGQWGTTEEIKQHLVANKDGWNQYVDAQARKSELKDEGVIVEHSRRECSMTGNTAWTVKPNRKLQRPDEGNED